MLFFCERWHSLTILGGRVTFLALNQGCDQSTVCVRIMCLAMVEVVLVLLRVLLFSMVLVLVWCLLPLCVLGVFVAVVVVAGGVHVFAVAMTLLVLGAALL